MTDKIKEYPILFTAPMVQAILDDKKHMTRRIVKLKEGETVDASTCWAVHPTKGGRLLRCPYGPKGSHLWTRETWRLHHISGASPYTTEGTTIAYRAGGAETFYIPHAESSDKLKDRNGDGWQWRPSIFMPRWASRLLLKNLGVRIERVQDISEQDAIAEGVTPPEHMGAWERAQHWEAREAFRVLWESINGPESWDTNPYVWAISFRRIQEGAK